MTNIEKGVSTGDIVSRDTWRIKNYRESLRGYQVREDVLENMFRGLDLEEIAKKKEIILADIGCGPGICGDFFNKEFEKKLKDKEINIKTIFIDRNQDWFEQIPDKKGYDKLYGDIIDIPLNDKSVDIITIKQVLDYLPKHLQIKALSEVNRVLKDDGKLILSALVSPAVRNNQMTNYLYTEREKIIAEKVAVEKFITDEQALLELLKNAGFIKNEVLYRYDIPLSTGDFKKGWNLTDEQQNRLKLLYEKISSQDNNGDFEAKKLPNDIELVEKAIIVQSRKQEEQK